MEKKTIGSFLSALRKAHGMTQKQLAEKLNVSDKAVSRWERDECAPDLTVIPVLAEIFGVTSDEILRGERKTEDKSAEKTDKKNEKQLEYILNNLKTKFLIKSIISGTVAVIGLIVAYILSIVVTHTEAHKIGFCVGCAFLIISAILMTVFTISTFSSLKNNEFDSEKLNDLKKKLVRIGKWTFLIIVFIFIISLDFVINIPPYGEIILIIIRGIAVCFFANLLVQGIIIKKGIYSVDEKTKKKSKLKLKCSFITLIVVALTFCSQAIFNECFTPVFDGGTTYTEFEELKEFLETPMDVNGNIVKPNKKGIYKFTTYFCDDEGYHENVVKYTEDEFEVVEVRVDKNTIERVVQRNQNIASYSVYSNILQDDEDIDYTLPITIHTYQDEDDSNEIMEFINICIVFLYVIEIVVGFIVYFIKRKKIKNQL